MLIGELSTNPGFLAYLKIILVPRLLRYRKNLISNKELSLDQRRELQAVLLEHESILRTIYALTGDGTLPENLENFFL